MVHRYVRTHIIPTTRPTWSINGHLIVVVETEKWNNKRPLSISVTYQYASLINKRHLSTREKHKKNKTRLCRAKVQSTQNEALFFRLILNGITTKIKSHGRGKGASEAKESRKSAAIRGESPKFSGTLHEWPGHHRRWSWPQRPGWPCVVLTSSSRIRSRSCN